MKVLMLSPGYPAEMRQFTRGLAEVGAEVIGVGDQPRSALAPIVKKSLADYHQVPSLWDENALVDLARKLHREHGIDRVECQWEPGVVFAGQMRDAIGAPGLTAEQSLPFRDKELMKQVLDRAGIRTPRHAKVHSKTAARRAVAQIGFPVILKPIAGAGATHTYRVDSDEDLERALIMLTHVDEVSVEEFVDGEEFTFDTICAGGRILYHNIAWYRPRPLEGKLHEHLSPQAICLRDLDADHLAEGTRMGVEVIKAMGFETGFSHMEWYRKADGEVVFGEIGARPPGARLVDVMNYASDIDTYRGWAEAVCHGRWTQETQRRYNAAIIFKRARGTGEIRHVEGIDEIRAAYGPAIVEDALLPIGSPRRDWRQLQISDGYLVVRHPDLGKTIEMADAVANNLTLYAG